MEQEEKIFNEVTKEFVMQMLKTYTYEEKVEWFKQGDLSDLNKFMEYCLKEEEYELCADIRRYVEQLLDEVHKEHKYRLN